jgi:predicted ATPase/class 3 adenylate cyclase
VTLVPAPYLSWGTGPELGEHIRVRCPNCGFDVPAEMKFCGQCGTRLRTTCTVCGFGNPLDYRFCGDCGAQLRKDSVVLTAAADGGATVAPGIPVESPQPLKPSAFQLEGERRLATVVVADVTGSTNLLERLGTEAWVEKMNQVLRLLEAEVYRFGGRVDQFRGDGLVAFFGATAAHEDDPERAVLAALSMQSSLKLYITEQERDRDFDLQLRVGVNTGEVIVTRVGDSRLYREDTAMGEAVALAARLEVAAKSGTVLVSGTTYDLTEPQFEWQSLGEIDVKGVTEPVAVYRPLAVQVDSGRTFPFPVPLIGRDDEFEALLGHVDDLFAGRGGITTVLGEKGLGKSFLVDEVRQHFARRGALLADAYPGETVPSAALDWIRGRCRSYDQTWPYSMWLSLLRNWLGVRRGEPKEAIRDRLRHLALDLWGDRLADYYAYLAVFLSLPLEDPFAEQIRHLDAEGLQQAFFPTIRAWVEAMAHNGPLVMEFSDMQWADTTSLELLKHCLPVCDDAPLLWLLVYRPERNSPVWEFNHYVETKYPHRLASITLRSLSETQGGDFIDQLIGPDVLPDDTRAMIINKAEGNPYYIGELVRALIAQGTLVQDARDGKWHTTRAVESLDLPDSLQSLLMARIDRLSTQQRYLLQIAAVIGSVFWSSVLEALAVDAAVSAEKTLEASSLRLHLTSLQREQLIYERGRVPDLGIEYVFGSNLVRDAAYDSLLSAQQLAYHRQIAEYLESHLSETALPHYYGVLSYHYQSAGEFSKELLYALLAAEQARRIYANVEALGYFDRALEILDELERRASSEEQGYAVRTQRLEVLNGRREVLYLLGEFDSMRVDAEAMLRLARQLDDDPAWLIDALLKQPGVANWQTREELEAGFALAQEALGLALDIGDRRREMQSLVAIAKQRLWVNDPTAWELAQRALDLARQLGDQEYEVDMLSSMGQVFAWTDHPQRGMAYLKDALRISQALDDKMAELRLTELIGLQCERDGNYYRLLNDYHMKRLRISREIGHRPVEADALMDCGQIQSIYLGDYERGLEMLRESLRIWEGTPSEAIIMLRIGQTLVAQGHYDEAFGAVDRAEGIINEQAVILLGHAGLLLVKAMLNNALANVENLEHALTHCEATRQLVQDAPLTRQYEMAAACEASEAHLGLADLARDVGARQEHRELSLAFSQTALDIYHQFGFVQIIECVSEEILYRHHRALAANGRDEESDAFLRQAYDEMMRKHEFIPTTSPFRATYLENITLHQRILSDIRSLSESLEESIS